MIIEHRKRKCRYIINPKTKKSNIHNYEKILGYDGKWKNVPKDKYKIIQFGDSNWYLVEIAKFAEYQFRQDGPWYLLHEDCNYLKGIFDDF